MVEELVLDLVVLGVLCVGIWLVRDMKNHLDDAIADLDTNLAAALQATISNLAGEIEPPNPFQQLIAQWIQNQTIQAPAVHEVLERNEKGHFEKKV